MCEYDAKRRKEKPDQLRESCRKAKENTKVKVFLHYTPSGKCVYCNFEDIRALSIDHINGGGEKHRKSLGMSTGGYPFYAWLVKNNYPDGYQVLCMNCQTIKKYENKECKARP